MSCNGCRVLRKGCSEECMLRHCLEWMENPQAQANATVFVAKFFGRAGLMSFVSSVLPNQRSPLFRSLLYEAVGRTINPVNGAVGLLWTGNWHLCQSGVEKVLRGGALTPLSEFLNGASAPAAEDEGFGSVVDHCPSQRDMGLGSRTLKRKVRCDGETFQAHNQCLGRSGLPERLVVGVKEEHRAATPSMEEESETTTLGSSAVHHGAKGGTEGKKLLRLFF